MNNKSHRRLFGFAAMIALLSFGSAEGKPTLTAPDKSMKLTVSIRRGQTDGNIVLEKGAKDCSVKAYWSSPWNTDGGERHLTVKKCISLFNKFEKLPNTENNSALCARNRMDIEWSGADGRKQQKASCYGVNAPTAAAYELFSQALLAPFNN